MVRFYHCTTQPTVVTLESAVHHSTRQLKIDKKFDTLSQENASAADVAVSSSQRFVAGRDGATRYTKEYVHNVVPRAPTTTAEINSATSAVG